MFLRKIVVWSLIRFLLWLPVPLLRMLLNCRQYKQKPSRFTHKAAYLFIVLSCKYSDVNSWSKSWYLCLFQTADGMYLKYHIVYVSRRKHLTIVNSSTFDLRIILLVKLWQPQRGCTTENQMLVLWYLQQRLSSLSSNRKGTISFSGVSSVWFWLVLSILKKMHVFPKLGSGSCS